MKKENITLGQRKQNRIFSEAIRKQIVSDIEKGRCTVTQASREIDVSRKTIYKWLDRYSRYLNRNGVLVMESKSDGYRTKELEARIKELEAALGRASFDKMFYEKLIEMANEEFDTDIKKISQTNL